MEGQVGRWRVRVRVRVGEVVERWAMEGRGRQGGER
jgi:hypothetical protein